MYAGTSFLQTNAYSKPINTNGEKKSRVPIFRTRSKKVAEQPPYQRSIPNFIISDASLKVDDFLKLGI